MSLRATILLSKCFVCYSINHANVRDNGIHVPSATICVTTPSQLVKP